MRTFHFDVMVEFFIKVLPYLKVTFTYVFFSFLFGTLLGALITMMRMSKVKVLNKIGSLYVTVMRCVPSVVLLFLVYYGLPMVLESYFDVKTRNLDNIYYVIVTFTLFLGASTSEVMRSAYRAVPKGQYEAAVTVGMTGWDAFRRIVFPQAFFAAIPNIGNVVIYLLKEGALAYTIGLQDVLGRGYYLNGLKGKGYALELYIALTFIYWPISLLLGRLFSRLEKKFSIEHKIMKNDKRRNAYEKGTVS